MLPELLAVARGERPADLLLRRARLMNVFSGQVESCDIAIYQGKIAGLGPNYTAVETIDLDGQWVAPGLIDAHVHIESSLCIPSQFAAAVLPSGVTTAVVDPHEIANVAGAAGVRYIFRSSRRLPLNVVIMAPSCVPATHMETTGGALAADDLALLLKDAIVHGLAEVMNYPGVIQGDSGMLSKITAYHNRPRDGHAPNVSGQALNAYAAAGIGSDHESTTVAEAAEKLSRGLYVLIREATNARGLQPLLPLITPQNSRRICFCTDDRMPGDLLEQGSIDYMVRTAIAYGIDPMEAVRMATLNTAEWFGLHDRGAIAPGRSADLILLDSLEDFRPTQVYAAGQLVATKGKMAPNIVLEVIPLPDSVASSVNVDWNNLTIQIPAKGKRLRAIGLREGQLITTENIVDAKIVDEFAVADPSRDLLKIAVIERHKSRGNVGLGFIQGLGLQRGAMAGTVAHDHHNLIVIGADDQSMLAAARAVGEMGGGLVVSDGEQILAALPLPVAGLMSDRPVAEVHAAYKELLAAAAMLGSPLHDPFMAMSFMGLEVIPKLKLTDLGLVDVEAFDFVDLFL
jgi:adenine deaminase